MIQEQSLNSTHHETQHSNHSLQKVPQDFFTKQAEVNLGCKPIATEFLGSDAFLCVGGEDGVTNVLSATKWNIQYRLIHQDKSPVMGLSSANDSPTGIRNAVMAAHSDGTVEYWHATSQQLLFSKKFEQNLQSCQISPNGQWYVVSAESGDMFIGHLNKGQPTNLDTGHLGSHSNRVFCIKWNPTDPNLFYSGGWDNIVYFWDLRTKASIHSLYGIYMGGQAIDLKQDKMLIGNNRNSNQLKVYDIKADKMRVIRWDHYSQGSLHSNVGVNSCFFGQGQDDFIVLTAREQVRLIRDQSCMSLYMHPEQAKGFSMAKSNNNKQIATTWSNGDLKILRF